MRHVTHANELKRIDWNASCHTCEGVQSKQGVQAKQVRHVTLLNDSCHRCRYDCKRHEHPLREERGGMPDGQWEWWGSKKNNSTSKRF